MTYDYRDYIDKDPELKQFLDEFYSDTYKSDQALKEYKNKIFSQKKLFQFYLARARRQSKLTQSQLAEKLGLTQAAISRIENGNPSLQKIIKYADAVGCQLTLTDTS